MIERLFRKCGETVGRIRLTAVQCVSPVRALFVVFTLALVPVLGLGLGIDAPELVTEGEIPVHDDGASSPSLSPARRRKGTAKELVGAGELAAEHCGSSFPPRPGPPGERSLRYTERSAQALTEYTEPNSKRAFIASGPRSFMLVLVQIGGKGEEGRERGDD